MTPAPLSGAEAPPAPEEAAVAAAPETAPTAPEDNLQEQVERMMDILRKQLDRHKAFGMDVSAIEDLYVDVETNATVGDWDAARVTAQKAMGDLDFARRNYVVEQLTYCYNLMQVAPDYIDIAGPKDMYNQANQLYAAERIDEALEMTTRCRAGVDRLKDEHEDMLARIEGCQRDLERGREIGVEMPGVAERIAASKTSLIGGDFEGSRAALEGARAEIDRVMEEAFRMFRHKAEVTLKAAQNLVESAEEKGVEVKDSKFLLDRARSTFEAATSADGFADVYEYVDRLQQNEAEAMEELRHIRDEEERLGGEFARLEAEVARVSDHVVLPELDSDLSMLRDAWERRDREETAGLIGKCRDTLKRAEGLSPEIFLEIAGEGLRPDVWSQISLVVSNVGKSHARNIRMNFDGPLEVRRVKTVEKLKAGGRSVMEVGIKFNGIGKVPIDIEIIYGRTLDEKQYLFSEETWLEVTGDGGARTVTRIGSSYECSYCKRVIEGADEGVVKCSCNLAYHESCARKSGKCPACSDDISNRPPIIRSQKVHHFERTAAGGAGAGAGTGVAAGAAGGAPRKVPVVLISDDDGTWLD